jgi:predicted MFS family arabinose efflux permease
MAEDPAARRSAIRLVALICAAQVLVQIGAFFWPALLPGMIGRWALTNSEAGWITAIFYAAYMVAVPILVTLTDRIDAKRVYLAGVAATVAGHVFSQSSRTGSGRRFAPGRSPASVGPAPT